MGAPESEYATGGYDTADFIATFYDHVVPYRQRQDLGFFVDAARRSGGPVLELACGTGRVLIPTARAGLEIVGLDLSHNMLAECRRRLAAEPPEVRRRATLLHGDMRTFEFDRQFALVTIPFRGFQHLLTPADQLRCLAAIRRHLRPGGLFILDIFHPRPSALADEANLGIEFGQEPEFTLPDNRRVVRCHRITRRDHATQVLHGELVYYATGGPHGDARARLVHPYQMRWTYRFEAEHLLARAGFEIVTAAGNYDGSALGSPEESPELVFTCRPAAD